VNNQSGKTRLAWATIEAWIDTEGNIRLAAGGREPEVRIWQKTDEIHALELICQLLKTNGVSRCEPRPKPNEPQTAEISITRGADVALIIDNIRPYLLVKSKRRQASPVRTFLSERKRRPV
jgi:hypothetical protein